MDENIAASANPYAAPKGDLSVQRAPDEAELAGRGRRFAAALIDGIIMMVIVVLPLALFFGGWAAYAAKVETSTFLFKCGLTFLSFAIYLLINGYFLAKDGQSIGKKLLSIKIVRTDGSQADFVQIVTRRLLPVQALGLIPVAGPFLPLVDALFIFRASHKCLHDEIADTLVIRI